jgi:hypothetical protein
MKPFTMITVIFLALIALVHLVRLLFAWDVTVQGVVVPVWVSAIAAVIPGALAIMLWRESRL